MTAENRGLTALTLSVLMVLSVLSPVSVAGAAAAANDSVSIHESVGGQEISGGDVSDGQTVYLKASDGSTSGGTKSATVSNPNGDSFSITMYDDGNGPDPTNDDGTYWGAFTVVSGSSNTDSTKNVIGVDETNDATAAVDLNGDNNGDAASVTGDYTSPSISTVSLGESSGDMTLSFDSDEQLGGSNSDLAVRVTGPNGATYNFDKSDFSESGSGTYTYTLTTSQAYSDGDGFYGANVTVAKDSAGNNGGSTGDGSGLTDSYDYSSGDTTAPTISSVSLSASSGNLAFSFDSDEQLGSNAGDIAVTVDSPSATDWQSFDYNDFSETDNGDGTYTYTLTASQAYNDGSGKYTATVDDAKDSSGNNGGVNGDGNALSDSYDTSDSTAPSISSVSITESSGSMAMSFDSNEQLGGSNADVTVNVTGPNGKTYSFTRASFSESGSGPYTYTYTGSQSFDDGDGTYTVSVDDAYDASGNNGGENGEGSDLTDTYDYTDTTAPSISSVSLDNANGRLKLSFVSDEVLGSSSTDIAVSVDAPNAGTDWKTYYRWDFTMTPTAGGNYKYSLVQTAQNGFDSGTGTYTLTIDDAKDSSGNNGGVNGEGSSLTDTHNYNPAGTPPAIVSKDVEYVSGPAKFQNDADVEKNIHAKTELTAQSFDVRLWVAGDHLTSTEQKRNLSHSAVGFTKDTEIKIRYTVENFDPDVLMGPTNASSWQINDKSGSKKEIVITTRPAVAQRNFNAPFSPSQWDSSKQGYKKSWEQAQVGVDALVSLQMQKFPAKGGLSKLSGARLNTDAQAFTTPSYDSSTDRLVFNVAAPHCKVGAKSDPTDPAADDECNDDYVYDNGFYKAVIPKAFWEDKWGSDLDVDNMSLVYNSGGTTETLTNVEITKLNNGDLYVEAQNIHYSSGDLETFEDTTDPSADAGSDTTADEDTSVSFDGSSSSDGETTITSYDWDVDGDGTYEKTGAKPSYTYSDPGTYTVTLRVTDDGNNTDTDTRTVTVNDVTAPTADAGSDATVDEGEQVTLDASASSDNDAISSYDWDVTDNGTYGETGTSVTHTYDDSGDKTVTLKVTDAAGNTDTDTVTITVESTGGDSSGGSGGGGGGSGGGGSGLAGAGDGDESDDDTDDVEVTQSDDRTDVHVREPSDDMTINVSSTDSEEDADADASVTVRQVSFDAGTDEAFTMNVSAHESAPAETREPDADDVGGEPAGYVQVDHSVPDSDLSDTRLRFTVGEAALNGSDPSDVVLYRYHDGEWVGQETSLVRDTGDGAVLEAELDGMSVFAVGFERGAGLSVTDASVDATTVTAGDSVTVTTTVTNDGTAEGTTTVELAAGGTVRDSTTVTVAPGESTAVELTTTFDESGAYDLSVAGTDAGTLTVSGATTATSTATSGGTATATETATRAGTEAAAETETPAGTAAPAGTPTATPTDADTPTTTPTASADGPGPGPAVALLAVVLAVLALARVRRAW